MKKSFIMMCVAGSILFLIFSAHQFIIVLQDQQTTQSAVLRRLNICSGHCVTSLPPPISVQNPQTNIIFLETSLKNRTLNSRQACAIESAALHNQKTNVTVFVTNAATMSENEVHVQILTKYENIHIKLLNMTELAKDSPIEQWFDSKIWNESRIRTIQLSDVLRMVSVWKYGGVYADLDVVVLKPLDNLRNSVICESDTSIINGVLSFDRFHPFLYSMMEDMAENYEDTFAKQGPILISKHVNYCIKSSTCDQSLATKCNFTLLSSKAAVAIPYTTWKWFFERKYLEDALKEVNNSLMTHAWNGFTSRVKYKIGEGAAYEVLAQRNCPNVFKNAQKNGNF